jgi:hypothetical protein
MPVEIGGSPFPTAPAHAIAGVSRFVRRSRPCAGDNLRESGTLVVRDAEGKAIEAAGGSFALSYFHQHVVPSLVELYRNAIGPVVVQFVPERSSQLRKHLLLVEPDRGPAVRGNDELCMLLARRVEVGVSVAHDPVMSIGIEVAPGCVAVVPPAVSCDLPAGVTLIQAQGGFTKSRAIVVLSDTVIRCLICHECSYRAQPFLNAHTMLSRIRPLSSVATL